ncbi:hypothetical protein [Piscinibacter gummiphilus]|uniref:Uncharacterized protein n=1 Tax=Piscinibacter gummiphilus TaxID=946333 RepID=A0ABZ0D7Y1_9BURK|nr:hypothetical protein [Piscinibacter gummiphilus]WOB11143.1 hypothetical protein RXV79_27280 [Piscinibacter gummiphilus]
MPALIDRDTHESTVQIRVWVDEHDWLHSVFRSPRNTAPRFRLGDLLSASITIALRDAERQKSLVSYLDEEFSTRDQRTERRTVHVWQAQFDLLQTAHRASWNAAPNPMFDLDHLATACVVIARRQPDALNELLSQARNNFIARRPVEGRRVLLS